MIIPNDWEDNIENGVITETMLSEALYSVNKRAKNYRDLKREYLNGFEYGLSDEMEEKENEMYNKKETLLSCVKPVCIHKESYGYKRDRVCDFLNCSPDYVISCLYQGLVVHTGSFYDRLFGEETYFADVEDREQKDYRYYLYYIVGNHTFHSPIHDWQLKDYSDLPVYFIGRITTEGHDVNDLVPVPFVDRLIALINKGNYAYALIDRSGQDIRSLAKAGEIDEKEYDNKYRQYWINNNLNDYNFKNYIFRQMAQYVLHHDTNINLSEQEKQNINDHVNEIVRVKLLDPLVNIDNELEKQNYKEARRIWKTINREYYKVLKISEPPIYSDIDFRNQIIADSLIKFGGKAVTVRELVETYPDSDNIICVNRYKYACNVVYKSATQTFEKIKSKYVPKLKLKHN